MDLCVTVFQVVRVKVITTKSYGNNKKNHESIQEESVKVLTKHFLVLLCLL